MAGGMFTQLQPWGHPPMPIESVIDYSPFPECSPASGFAEMFAFRSSRCCSSALLATSYAAAASCTRHNSASGNRPEASFDPYS